jgi:Holliday junction resolvase RusA-like endonuclease
MKFILPFDPYNIPYLSPQARKIFGPSDLERIKILLAMQEQYPGKRIADSVDIDVQLYFNELPSVHKYRTMNRYLAFIEKLLYITILTKESQIMDIHINKIVDEDPRIELEVQTIAEVL